MVGNLQQTGPGSRICKVVWMDVRVCKFSLLAVLAIGPQLRSSAVAASLYKTAQLTVYPGSIGSKPLKYTHTHTQLLAGFMGINAHAVCTYERSFLHSYTAIARADVAFKPILHLVSLE